MFAEISAESVFGKFVTIVEDKTEEEAKEIGYIETSQTKQDTAQQPQPSFYTENDSDNESDFDVKYEQSADQFGDIQKKTAPQRPLYL